MAHKKNKRKSAKAGVLEGDVFTLLSSSARRSLEDSGVYTAKHLAECSEAHILALHDMNPASLEKLRSALAANGLAFKENKKNG